MPVLKRFKKYVFAFFKLGQTHRLAKEGKHTAQETQKRLDELQAMFRREMDTLQRDFTERLEAANRENSEQHERLEAANRENREQHERLEAANRENREQHERLKAANRGQQAAFKAQLDDKTLRDKEVSRRLAQILSSRGKHRTENSSKAPQQALGKGSEGLQTFLDTFYNCLENRFRGSPEIISNRLRTYQPDVEAAVSRTNGKPALDLACGRGEWLGLMRELGVDARGVDINAVQIASAQTENLKAYHKDAFEALKETEDNSLSIISAHHFIEHISFPDLAWMTLEAQRALAPGGLLLFETPNPENIIVGATSFYIDPTHKHPLPWQLLEVLFDTAGFQSIETRRLHPGDNFDAMRSEPNVHAEIARLLFGPQDLAILGMKPLATE